MLIDPELARLLSALPDRVKMAELVAPLNSNPPPLKNIKLVA